MKIGTKCTVNTSEGQLDAIVCGFGAQDTVLVDGGSYGRWETSLSSILVTADTLTIPTCNDPSDLHKVLRDAIVDILSQDPAEEPIEEILLLATVSKRLNHTRFSHDDFTTALHCLDGLGKITVKLDGDIRSWTAL